MTKFCCRHGWVLSWIALVVTAELIIMLYQLFERS